MPTTTPSSPIAAAPFTPGASAPPAPAAAPRRARGPLAAWIAVALLALVHVALAWAQRVPGMTLGGDDAQFIELARSLRHFGYRETHLVGAPLHAKFPPGFPALIAAATALFGDSIDVVLAANALLSAAALVLLFDLVRRRWSPELALLVVAPAALNPSLVVYAGSVMAESLFLFLLVLALWALRADRPTPGMLALAGGAALAAAFTRSAGVTVAAAIGLLWLLERRWRAAAIYAAVSALLLGGWFAYTLAAPRDLTGEVYLADTFVRTPDPGMQADPFVVALARRAVDNAVRYGTRTLPTMLPLPSVPGTVVDNILILLSLAVLGAAGALAAWKRWRAGLVVLAAYAALLLVWPWAISRFLSPAIPLVLVLLLAGAVAIGRRLGGASRPRGAWALAAALAAVVAVTAMARQRTALAAAAACDRSDPTRSPGCFDQREREYFELARLVVAETPPEAVFVVAKEPTFGYLTRRRTVPFIRAVRADGADVLDYATRAGASYVILANVWGSEPRLAEKLVASCTRLDLVRALSPEALLFRIRPAGAPAGDRTACGAIDAYLARLGGEPRDRPAATRDPAGA